MSRSMKGFTVAVASNFADMKLPELKEVARQMGLRGVSTMRKSQLVATLEAARSGGKAPAGVTVGVPRRGRKPASKPNNTHSSPDSTTTSTSSVSPSASHSSVASTSSTAAAPSVAPTAASSASAISSQPSSTTQSASKSSENTVKSANSTVEHAVSEQSADLSADRADRSDHSDRADNADHTDRAGHIEDLDLGIRLPRQRRHRAHSLDDILASLPDNSHDTSRDAHDDQENAGRRRYSHRVVRTAGPAHAREGEEAPEIRTYRLEEDGESVEEDSSHTSRRDHRDEYSSRTNRRDRRSSRDDRDERSGASRRYNRRHDSESDEERLDRRERDNRSDRFDRSDREDRANRSERFDQNEQSERADRMDRDRAEHTDQHAEEQTAPVAGIVDLLDSYAFIRTSGYLPGPNDVYVSMGMVKKYGLRKSDAVQGTIRIGGNHRQNRHQKFVPIRTITSINGMSVEDAAHRPQFEKLTPVYPSEPLKMETTQNKLIGRMIDIVAPIGKGQRGLIVSPPKAGKTMTLQAIANAIHTNNPECHIMVVLVDERPEEVTDMERTVHGEVISSTFDKPATEHTVAAEMAIERAKRLVEMGQDVVVLLDSMTRLARAYNISAPASGRVLTGGVDAQALYPPKRFFGAARNIENGGSLTIIASALVETGSKMDEVIFEEFKGTGNMELRLSRDLSDKRMFPAIDVNASSTRREELLMKPDKLRIVYGLRRAFGDLEPEQVYSRFVPLLKKTPSNEVFFSAIAQQMNIPVNK